jgi:hypothetical protein
MPQLVAGSGTTQSQDEADNAPLDENSTHTDAEEKHHHDDGYSAGVPGPLTRLFVIANRGIANLIQDLILVCIVVLVCILVTCLPPHFLFLL